MCNSDWLGSIEAMCYCPPKKQALKNSISPFIIDNTESIHVLASPSDNPRVALGTILILVLLRVEHTIR